MADSQGNEKKNEDNTSVVYERSLSNADAQATTQALPKGTLDPVYEAKATVLNNAVSGYPTGSSSC